MASQLSSCFLWWEAEMKGIGIWLAQLGLAVRPDGGAAGVVTLCWGACAPTPRPSRDGWGTEGSILLVQADVALEMPWL